MAVQKETAKKRNGKTQVSQNQTVNRMAMGLVVAFTVLSLIFASLAFFYYT